MKCLPTAFPMILWTLCAPNRELKPEENLGHWKTGEAEMQERCKTARSGLAMEKLEYGSRYSAIRNRLKNNCTYVHRSYLNPLENHMFTETNLCFSKQYSITYSLEFEIQYHVLKPLIFRNVFCWPNIWMDIVFTYLFLRQYF